MCEGDGDGELIIREMKCVVLVCSQAKCVASFCKDGEVSGNHERRGS